MCYNGGIELIKIYLAGKMGGLSFDEMNGWREKVSAKLTKEADLHGIKIRVVNPVQYYNFEYKKHQTEIEVEEFDLAHVISSDIVIVNLQGLNDSIGTIIELHNAHYHHKVPVIAFSKRELYDKLHPWVKNDITRVEDNIDDVIAYIRDFYFM